jgi:hypothetical protein
VDVMDAYQVEARLVELRAEQAQGERVLADLNARRDRLVSSMLRISGAIEILEELVTGGTTLQDKAEAPVTAS